MLELLAISALVGIGLVLEPILLVIGLFLKLAFRLLLLPFALLGGLLKVLLIVALLIVGLTLAPVLLGVVLVLAIPVLILLGLFGLGWAVAAA